MNEDISVAQVEKGRRFGVRHIQALLLVLNAVVIYMSRLNVSVSLVAMTNSATTNPNFQEFPFTSRQKSYIMSSFFWGFAINQFPGGYLSRRFGSKIVMFVGTFGSAVCSLLIPFLVRRGGWQIFCGIRSVQGFAQGLLFLAIPEHITNWAPPHERPMFGALTHWGADIGTVLAMLVSGLMAISPLGWPGISYISAGVSFAWCFLWLLLSADKPASSCLISKEERQYIEVSIKRHEDLQKKKIPVPWFAMFKSVPLLVLVIVRCADAWGFTAFQSQMPSYFNGVLNMNMKSNTLFATLPYLGRLIISCTYFVFGNMVMRKGWLSPTAIRKIASTTAFWLPAFLVVGIGFINVTDRAALIALMTLNVALSGAAYIGCNLCANDLSPNHTRYVMGIVNPIVNVIPLFTPLSVGVLVPDVNDHYEFQIVFTIAACGYFVANLLFIVFGSARAQPWNSPDYLSKNNVEEPAAVVPKSIINKIIDSADNVTGKSKGWPLENMEHTRPYIIQLEENSVAAGS